MAVKRDALPIAALGDLGYEVPRYDVAALRARTLKSPRWIHFGAGNLFRAFIAAGADRAASAGALDGGIIACASAESNRIAFGPLDGAYVSVALGADGGVSKQLVGCVAAALDPAADFEALAAMFRDPALQLVSLTITEKGYTPGGLMATLARLMTERLRAGGHPIALVSMDNCARNGDVLRRALLGEADAEGATEGAALRGYLSDSGVVSFPWTMIDKITPGPNPAVADMLLADGLAGMEIRTTARGALAAPFVNAEAPGYLVIEDDFPNGRPDLAACGFLLADRDTVARAERMKVTACLNPLHTALAVFGCLLGYRRISEEMKDVDLVRLVERLGYAEGLPVVDDPGLIDPRAFLDTVLRQRFPNPFVPDAPQRIATDTSQKLPIRFGETIKAHLRRGDAGGLRALPLTLAGWLRYLTGIDDDGQPFALSPDPMLPALAPLADHLREKQAGFDEALLMPLLKDERVFGVDLVEAGLSGLVIAYLKQMLEGRGAVRRTLHRAANEWRET